MTAKTDITPYKGHFKLYLVVLFASIVVFLVSAILSRRVDATGWEHTLFLNINGWSEGAYRTMAIATFFGSAWMAALSVAGAYFTRFYRLAGRLALSIVAAYGLTAVFKHLISRERPAEFISETVLRTIEPAMGFPSTHTAVAAVIMLTLLPYLRGQWRWIVPVIIAGVALSRLYLGAHLPLDVIGGAAIGIAIVAFVRVLPQPLRVALRID
jgi:undecaprenyl-diphosphatase